MKRLGVIGAGKIVPFHIEALKHSGFIISAISATPGSKNSRNLAEQFQIPKVFDDYEEMLDSNLDALLIAVSKEALLPILEKTLPSGKKILIEKPVFIGRDGFVHNANYVNNVMVAYNRRFYSTVKLLKDSIARSKFGSFYFHVPEISWHSNPTMENVLDTLQGNTVHYLDLLHFILGNRKLVHYSLEQSDVFGTLSKFLFLDYGSIKGVLHITFGSPGNYRFDFQNGSILSSLSPIELYNEFDSMSIEQPTQESPIRRYRAINSRSDYMPIIEDSLFKPGFLGQSIEFFNFVNGEKLINGANLDDAVRAARLADAISTNSLDYMD